MVLNCAVVGTGFIGEMHLKAIEKIEDYNIVAVADTNETTGKKAAVDFNCAFYTDAEEMLKNENIDVVHICLPTSLHEKFVLLCAQYKKHVLCEKPFTLTFESVQRMVSACEEAGVKLMIAQAARWWPEFAKIKEMYEQGDFGDLHMVYCNRLAQYPNWTSWHRDPKNSGGGLFDMNSHNIDYLYSLFGPVESVYAVGWKCPSGCWNHVISTLTFKNGVKAVDEGSNEIVGDFPFTISLRMTGDNGTLDYKFTAGFNIENLDAASAQTIFFEKDKPAQKLEFSEVDAIEAETRDYINAIRNGTPLPVPIEESVEVTKVVLAIQESLETGKLIVM